MEEFGRSAVSHSFVSKDATTSQRHGSDSMTAAVLKFATCVSSRRCVRCCVRCCGCGGCMIVLLHYGLLADVPSLLVLTRRCVVAFVVA